MIALSLDELLEQIRSVDLELGEVTETDGSVVVKIPAAPQRGQKILEDAQARIAEVVGEEIAGHLIPSVRSALARPTSNFAIQSKAFKMTPTADGNVMVELSIDGKPSGAFMEGGEFPKNGSTSRAFLESLSPNISDLM